MLGARARIGDRRTVCGHVPRGGQIAAGQQQHLCMQCPTSRGERALAAGAPPPDRSKVQQMLWRIRSISIVIAADFAVGHLLIEAKLPFSD